MYKPPNFYHQPLTNTNSMKRINKANIAKEPNKAGIYRIYNAKRQLEYVGISRIMRHRLQSYYQVDDYSVNTTKKALRPHAVYYDVRYMPIDQARRLEMIEKRKGVHNISLRTEPPKHKKRKRKAEE